MGKVKEHYDKEIEESNNRLLEMEKLRYERESLNTNNDSIFEDDKYFKKYEICKRCGKKNESNWIYWISFI